MLFSLYSGIGMTQKGFLIPRIYRPYHPGRIRTSGHEVSIVAPTKVFEMGENPATDPPVVIVADYHLDSAEWGSGLCA